MKRLLPYLLSVVVVALVVSSLNISIHATNKNENAIIGIPTNPRDSFMKEEQLRRQALLHDGSGIDFFSFGTRKIEKTSQYFLRLGEYYRQPGVSFDIKNGNSIYRHPVTSTGNDFHQAGFKEETIPVRYAYDPFLEENRTGAVLIPVSKGSYTLLQIFTLLVFIAAVVLILYCGFYNFFRVLLDIAKGNSFSRRNTSRLYTAGFTFLLVPIIPLLLLQVADWYFGSSIPDGLSFSFFRSLRDGLWTHILAGSLVLVTAIAFEKGRVYKREVDTLV